MRKILIWASWMGFTPRGGGKTPPRGPDENFSHCLGSYTYSTGLIHLLAEYMLFLGAFKRVFVIFDFFGFFDSIFDPPQVASIAKNDHFLLEKT